MNKISERAIGQYGHNATDRLNNPPVGLVTSHNDTPAPPATYQYDPHLDPQLVWAGKAERMSFEVPTVSLHVHERIDPKTVIDAARPASVPSVPEVTQPSLFEQPMENPPLRDAIHFYKHRHNWSNRLVAGDSLLVMNSLLQKEGMAGKVQMIYIDPPYGVKYGSNFQPFVNRRNVTDGKDDDLTQEPEMIRAFRDTWELGIHSYLTYMRDRLLLARELLHESGSVFVQISDENIHLVRSILDEIFGKDQFRAIIPFRKKTMPLGTKFMEQMDDFIIWYSRKKDTTKYRRLYQEQSVEGDWHYQWADLPDGTTIRLTKEQVRNHALVARGLRLYMLKSLEPSGIMPSGMYAYNYGGRDFPHPKNGYATPPEGLRKLELAKRLAIDGNRLAYKLYADDFAITVLTSPWQDTIGPRDKTYAVQTSNEVIARCLLMTTDPGDLVLDPTCGSGTTAHVAEQWGRRWITCDTSRVAVTLARQRLMTALFDYYELAHPNEGVDSGFRYKTVPHVTLKSVANDEPPAQETLYDQPFTDRGKARITGPFTVEAVPSPTVKPLADEDQPPAIGDASVARSGPTLRHAEWRDELLKTGIRGKNGQMITFSRVEPLGGTRYLHAEAETKEDQPRRVVVSFGPEHAPLEQTQVELAWEEARTLAPTPAILVYAAFQFDPEAAKDIDELTPQHAGMTLLKVQMNTDLLTDDLKKKRSNNQSFWLIGQPDVELRRIMTGEHAGLYEVEVAGFDYYDTRTGSIESGDSSKIAAWFLDTDYDGRSLFPRQVFFPLAGEGQGWSRLARSLKAELDEDRIEAYKGTVSLPFSPGRRRRVAVKVVDDRGIESLKIVAVE